MHRPSIRRSGHSGAQDLCEFKAILIYIVSSRTTHEYLVRLCLNERRGSMSRKL